MPLQFFNIDPATLDSLTGSISDLTVLAKSNIAFEDDAVLAFLVIRHAANDPSTLPENEVRSIDTLVSRGTPLYTKQDESFVHHLSTVQLADSMIDLTRLTADRFTELACQYLVSSLNSVPHDNSLLDESADQILREFVDQTSGKAATAVDSDDNSSRTEHSDWLNAFHWDSIGKLRSFVENALQMNAEILRLDAG